jgi:fatty-acyl-CoA synthase
MRRDADGYFFFVDRIGDTFRWKGENVATAEVAAALTAFEGVTAAAVYGVTLPGADGRAGMATIVADTGLDLDRLRTHLVDRLPDYARPRFLRLTDELDMTATFKPVKRELQRQGYDPGASSDPIYVDDPARQAYVRLDADLHARIQRGDIRVR